MHGTINIKMSSSNLSEPWKDRNACGLKELHVKIQSTSHRKHTALNYKRQLIKAGKSNDILSLPETQ